MPLNPKKLSEKDKIEEANKKIQHKLNSLKTDFEADKVKNFDQVFALIGPSVWAKMMNMGYDTFLNKSSNPGNFTNNELVRFAELLNVDINIILKFIFTVMKYKNKFREGASIRL